jgi:hypothetical protein
MGSVSKAQNPSQSKLIDELNKHFSKNLKFSGFKDSVALYTFSIKLDLEVEKNKDQMVVYKINDSIGKLIFKDLSFLKTMDYTPLLKDKKQLSVVIPVGVVMARYNETEASPCITIKDLDKKILKLFNVHAGEDLRNDGLLYLPPFVIYVDKTVYD